MLPHGCWPKILADKSELPAPSPSVIPLVLKVPLPRQNSRKTLRTTLK
jgi:hypothetical protein